MSLYKRGNIWWMEVKDESGKTAQISTKMKDRAAAENLLRVHNAEQAYGLTPKVREVKTLKQAMEQWYIDKKDNRSIKSDHQRGDWWISKMGHIPLKQIDVRIVNEIIEAKRKKDGISDGTSNRYLALLRAVLKRAKMKWGWLERAPDLMLYSEPDGRERFLELDQIAKLQEELPEHLREMVTFALSTGLRTSNITKLKWDWVNLARETLTVPVGSFKQKRSHTIPLAPTAVAILKRQIGRHPERVFTYKVTNKKKGDYYRPVGKIRTDAWHKALARAEIKDFRVHDLRHTFASHHIMNGTPLVVLQALGGWKDPKMVLRYAQQNTNSLRKYEVNSCV